MWQVLVLNGDSYIQFFAPSLVYFHKTKQADATILLSSATQGSDYGNVELEDDQRIRSFQEKPKDSDGQFINAGVYCLQKDLIQRQRAGSASLETDWFPHWLLNERVFGMVQTESVHDIGTPERFEFAKQIFKKIC